ncbi:2-C-methyl-D-erythritol 4-phosphate cytidylyltransferase [Thiomonas arsenitoxydans]|uniref:2-C-methyl-D-erythritol 4-phosphate cytidylyltransferase n=1 Tax=Thiomonas arsenitoxydans (strain DSM 22701 / CIP 110005 / 3As) TaxID=426114 RepID=D6CTZ3_THIA3|nr:2-C-methyl-D-erythritol 4-phosphate cytidylyltransferase [Thiomonas arsenitoxydans]CAZ88762.1 putative 2-C-methyl-D-erythritol 4-phosphate cytidylyltransferase (4-diphosphocytidyl-2C-methyl-D-erythritol synthase) (MEP cytidylyltransferase) (MCT) (CDP-ME synthetase) (IspD) [Thiomonas arsenitoxydans]
MIPSAGSGSRLPGDAPKQYRRLLGESVVQHTVRAILQTPRIASVSVVVQEGDVWAADALQPDPRLHLVPRGGATRAHSVLGGLEALLDAGAAHDDWALVHDAARCCITPELIDRLIDACLPDDVGGLLALPLPDTLKAADPAGRVAHTEPREGRWLAQTPQMFRIGALREALRAAIIVNAPPTDEAGAMERQGAYPLLVTGASWNFKITYSPDLELAQALLAARAGVST